MFNAPITRCLLVLLLTTAHAARAQSPAPPKPVPTSKAPDQRAQKTPPPTPPPANLRLLAIGNFLGQFDGFCEPPGGPYDLALPDIKPCHPGGPGGKAPDAADDKRPEQKASEKPSGDSKWPAALGGLIGAEEWIQEHTRQSNPAPNQTPRPRPRLLLQGNNQTPDFADALARVPPQVSLATQREIYRQEVDRRQKRANSASELFWTRVAQLKPAAIALGPDDFYRSLRLSSANLATRTSSPGDTAATRFVKWIREQVALPFVASNAIVSVDAKKLNTLERGSGQDRYELVLNERSSAGWLKNLTIKHRCGSIPTFTLQWSPTGDHAQEPNAPSWQDVATEIGNPSKQAVDCETTLKVQNGALRPGTFFRLTQTVPPPGTAEKYITFRTHAALTPAASSVPGLEGWPARLVPLLETPSTDAPGGTAEGPDEMLIVSLVSQTTREALGKPVWTWEITPSTESTEPKVCTPNAHKTICRIDFLPPADALSAILEQVLTVRKRLPFIVLLSMMDDDDTLDIMERFPEIRAVVLPPESTLLGRAARETPEGAKDSLAARLAGQGRPAGLPNFSGDLGMIGILDADKTSATRLIVRPEWVGETIADVDLYVAYTTEAQEISHWTVIAPSTERAKVATVPGVPLVAGVGPVEKGFPTVVYWPEGHKGPPLETEPYIAHLKCVEADARPMCKAFKDVWTDAPSLLAVTASALRDRSRADIVVVPEDLADGDAVAWMNHALSKGDTSWLSGYILHRVAFRPYRFVRATVGGDKLLAMLQKVLDDPLGNGSTYCIAGLGDDLGCPSKLPSERLEKTRVNGRVIQPNFFYTVTLPDRLAEQQQLRHSDNREDGFDAIDALQASLNPLESLKLPGSAGAWYPEDWTDDEEAAPSIIARLEEDATERTKHYINVGELEFGVLNIDARAPDGGRKIPGNIDSEIANVSSYNSKSVLIKADAVALDFKRHAVRGIFELEYAKRTEVDSGVVSYDRNRLLVGPRVDLWKVRTLGDLRPYVGYFQEGPIRDKGITLTASRSLGEVTRPDGEKLAQTESAGFTTQFTTLENTFQYGAVGADVVVNTVAFRKISWFEAAVSRAKLEWATGDASRLPLDMIVEPDAGGPLPGVNLATIRAQCPDKSTGARSGDAKALLNAFFTCTPDALIKSSVVELVTGNREQNRTQLELEGTLAVKLWSRTFKVTLTNQFRTFNVRREDADPPSLDLAIDRTNRFKMQISVPVIWRLEFAPTYEHQYARIQAGDVFKVKRWDVKFKMPLFFGLSRPPFAG